MGVRLLHWLLILLLSCCTVKSELERLSLVLDPSEKFNVSWSFDANVELPSRDITFTITCATNGWVGIGLSPNGGMAGADIIVAWVDSNGKGHLKDMHATQNGLPLVDGLQDVELNSYSERNGVTTITFTRKINTCDEMDDNIIATSTTRLIYAYGATDPGDNVLSNSDYHGSTNRGIRSVYLLDPQTQPEKEPSDVAYFDMLIPNYQLPPVDTVYYCAFFEPPTLDRKHHIISVEGIIQAGNEALVHHIVVYACWGVAQEHIKNNNKTEGVCYTAEMPEFFESCRSVVLGWAIGGTKFYFPDNAGYPIGADDGLSPEYFLMEMHYDNPEQLKTWVDSSGIRLTYTPTLREEDLGTVAIGTVFGIAVPPRPERFRVVAYCSSHCTNQWIPEEGVNVVSYILHSHLLGVAVQIDWFRNDELLGVFAKDDSYDFNFQDSRLFTTPKKLLPGDTLKITCTYSDSIRDRVTYGGLGTSEEMCLGYLSYYPKANISNCQSVPNFVISTEETLYTELSLNAQRQGQSVNLRVLDTVTNWTKHAVDALQDAFEVSGHSSLCYRTGDESYEDNFQNIPSASFPMVQEKADNFCKKKTTSGADAARCHIYLIFVITVLLSTSAAW